MSNIFIITNTIRFEHGTAFIDNKIYKCVDSNSIYAYCRSKSFTKKNKISAVSLSRRGQYRIILTIKSNNLYETLNKIINVYPLEDDYILIQINNVGNYLLDQFDSFSKFIEYYLSYKPLSFNNFMCSKLKKS